MKQTKGAIGNLINRYRAVLKKCHLLNTFGSLAVAGMLVMGGAGVAQAAEVNPRAIVSYTGSEFIKNEDKITTDDGAAFSCKADDATGTISVTASGQTTGRGVVTNLYNEGTSELTSLKGITITDSTFTDNKGEFNGAGGAAVTLWSDGTEGAQPIEHSIIGSTFSGNSAQSFGGAVAIFKQNAFDTANVINISNSTFSKNMTVSDGSTGYGGALYIEKDTVNIDSSSSYTENKSQEGGAIFIDKSSTLNINGTTFEKNEANYGGAIAGDHRGESSLNIVNGIFKENTAKKNNNNRAGSGGAIALWTDNNTLGTHNISGEFTNNKAERKGGAIAFLETELPNGAGELTRLNATVSGTFTGNEAGISGGAIQIERAQASLNSADFTENKSQDGGAVFVNRDSILNINNNTYKENEATRYGGAIAGDFTGDYLVNINNTDFIGNRADADNALRGGAGGAIALWNNDDPNSESHHINANFKDNYASQKGGAIAFLTDGDTALKAEVSGNFEGNSAKQSGGAIHFENTDATLQNTNFTNNRVTDGTTSKPDVGGGAIFNDQNSELTFRGINTFTKNTFKETPNDITNKGDVLIADGITTLNSGYTQSGEMATLSVKDGATLESLGTTMQIEGGSATFEGGSTFVVNGSNITELAAIKLSGSATLNVDAGANLLVRDAVDGQTYNIVDNASSGTVGEWKNVASSSSLIELSMENGRVTSTAKDAASALPGLSSELAGQVNGITSIADRTNSEYAGVRFLARATDSLFLGNDAKAAVSTIESAARIAFAGAVPQMTKMASDAATNAVVNRLSFANPENGAKAMNVDGKLVDDKALGLALWIAPLWSNQTGFGMEAGNLDYGYNANLGGVSLGADYTWANNIRAGLMFNIGGGYAESAGGDLSETTNSMTFWGVGAYGGWEYNNFAVMADVSYTSTWNSVDQDLDHRMGMGDLEADIQASAISAGLRFEYKLETQYLDLIPHVGARYMSINTWGYDVNSADGTILEGDGFQQNIWTFPVGITFSKELEMNNDWYFKPSVDFTVIPAAGDIKAKEDVRFTGPWANSAEIETQMMDYFTWQGGVGLEFGNDNMSVGVNYTLQAGQNSTGHGVFGMFRYEF